MTPLGLSGGQKGPGGHTKSRSNEKMLLINFVAYASVMTKMHLGWPPQVWPRVAPGHAASPEELEYACEAGIFYKLTIDWKYMNIL